MLVLSIQTSKQPKSLSDNQPTIEIANQQSLIIDEAPVVSVVSKILRDYGILRGEVSIAIVDDPSMKELNRQYLEHDYETDVLSFVLDFDQEQELMNGQLIVSADTAAREAAELGVSLQAELMLYVVHGALHLVGFDDKSPADAMEMRAAEREYLEPFGWTPVWGTDSDNEEVN